MATEAKPENDTLTPKATHEALKPSGLNGADEIVSLPGAFTLPEVEEAASNMLRLHDRLKTGRKKHLLLGARLSNEMQKYLDKRRFTEESILSMVDTLSLQRAEGLARTPASSFTSLKAQLAQDGAELSKQSQATMNAAAEVDSARYQAAEIEAQFMDAFSQFMKSLPGGTLFLDRIMSEGADTQDIDSVITPSIPDLAQRYFDRIAAIRVLEEIMADTYSKHELIHQQREFRRDHDQTLHETDEEFERQHRESLATLAHQIEEERQKATCLKQECEVLGYDLERLRYRHLSSYSSGSQPEHDAFTDLALPLETSMISPSPEEYFASATGFPTLAYATDHGFIDPANVHLSPSQRSEHNVEQWLSTVRNEENIRETEAISPSFDQPIDFPTTSVVRHKGSSSWVEGSSKQGNTFEHPKFINLHVREERERIRPKYRSLRRAVSENDL